MQRSRAQALKSAPVFFQIREPVVYRHFMATGEDHKRLNDVWHNSAARPSDILFSRWSSSVRSMAASLDASAGFTPAASSSSAGSVT